MKKHQNRRFIISGGGTGGHIFPAISIANQIRNYDPGARILFVGALGRMEMERVPAAGYEIVGLPISGFIRKPSPKNLIVLMRILISLRKARSIIREFQPDMAVGVGGYASGPLLRKASNMGIPTVLQEQNSYAGVTNKLLAKKALKIFVAYQGMEKYFPEEKIILTGNPVREELLVNLDNRYDATSHFGLKGKQPVLLVLGGSLGARTINQSIISSLQRLADEEVEIIWQSGKLYFEEAKRKLNEIAANNIKIVDFISRMDFAYAAADVIISRAGAGTISELCLVGKPVILVPSPNVAEDHQTHNAMALVNNNAAIMVKDSEAGEKLTQVAINLIKDKKRRKELGDNCHKMALPDSAKKIVEEMYKLIN